MSQQAPDTGGDADQRGRRLRDASLVTAVMVLSSVLGLARDLVLAATFGASAEADAFFVAWTVPETVVPLVTESGLGLVLVPLFARVWAAEGSLTSAIRRTLLPVVVSSLLVGAAAALAAPLVVRLLAPGLADPALATACFRWASITVFGLGLAGYLESALRGRGSYVRPAFMYVAYNIGIIGCLALTPVLGVRAAAMGLAVGSLLMLVVLGPAVARSTELTGLRLSWAPRGELVALTAVLPLVVYSLARQGQVFAERYFGSSIPGAISQLNYAAKVAQIPVGMAELFAVVTVAAVTARLLRRQYLEAGAEIESALRSGLCLIVPSTVALEVLAPGVVNLLLGRGAFEGEAADMTATLLRWYSIGLPGQFVVGACVLYVCIERTGARTAAGSAIACLVLTVAVDALAVGPMGPSGLALGNALGITVAAVVLLHRLSREVVRLPWGSLAEASLRSASAAIGAGLLAALVASVGGTGVLATVLAAVLFLVAHVALACMLGLEEARTLVGWTLRSVARRRRASGSRADDEPAEGSDQPPTGSGRQ